MVGILVTLLCMASPAYAISYTYDYLNRLTSVTYENGQKLTYTYDAAGNLLSVTVTGDQGNGSGEPLIWKPKTISDKYKVWTIRFNMPVDASTINNQNITVTDASGNLVDVMVEPGSDGRSAIVTPVEAYLAGQMYHLNIGKGIKSTSGKSLKRPVIMQFIISKE